jgi:thiamine biosynthesis protein ThiS
MEMQVEVVINGERRNVPDGLNLETLLDYLELRRDRVAVELNRSIVKRESWSDHPVRPGDRLEIVHFVGGGSYD